ncbi:hypothetical protein ACPWSR_03315 [Alloiococcus sp. CFN-8]|uniref:hypothetical protein n=1 Tax=Alloiococcus sp. CFN-8 TaxID=3416081 RepID=UPI003CEDB72A
MHKKKELAGYTMIVSGITALICVLIFLVLGYQFILKPNIEFEAQQSLNQAQYAGASITIPGFEEWNIKAGETKVSSNFYNPEDNQCYFVLSVTLDETGEEIYKSKYLKPGQHLYEVELKKALSKGSYEATLHYSTFTIDDNTPMNGADVPFVLIAK